MLDFLLGMPGPLAGAAVVAVSVALALGGLAAVRRRFRAEDLRAGNEVAGVLYAIIGGVYGVLLAFVVVAVWEDFGHAEEHVENEVAALGLLFRDAQMFPEPARGQVRAALADYARSVADDEWDAMAEGEDSAATEAAYERLWSAYYALDPGTDARTAVYYEQSVDRLGEVGANRGGRLLVARSGVPATLWALLVFGGVIVIALTYLFGADHPGTHRVAVAALAAVVSSVLFVTLALDHPFRAGISLSRRPFVELVRQWSIG